MGRITIRATRELIDKPIRREGQEDVSYHLLQYEPWFILSAQIEFEVGGSTEEEAIQDLADALVEIAGTDKVIELTRYENYGALQYEAQPVEIELPEGRDRSKTQEVAERPLKDGDDHPSPVPQSSIRKTWW